MAAPIVGFFVAFFTGAVIQSGTLAGGAGAAIVAIDARAAQVDAALPQVCAALQPTTARLATALAATKATRARALIAAAQSRLARDVSIVCADAANEPNTPAGRVAIAVSVLADIARADGIVPPAIAPARVHRGR
jgi:hypothetical protein